MPVPIIDVSAQRLNFVMVKLKKKKRKEKKKNSNAIKVGVSRRAIAFAIDVTRLQQRSRLESSILRVSRTLLYGFLFHETSLTRRSLVLITFFSGRMNKLEKKKKKKRKTNV